jgi:hypothetical protein
MNWKEFLKPDWRKIVLTVILMFIPLPMYVDTFCSCYSPPCQCPKKIMFYPLLLSLGIGLLTLPIDLVISYLLSCLIVWIYDKRKKK